MNIDFFYPFLSSLLFVFKQAKYIIRNFFAPPFCAYCKLYTPDDVVLCIECKEMVKPIVSHDLPVTKTKTVRVFAVSSYEPPIRSLILAKGARNCAVARQLGLLIWTLTDVMSDMFDYVVPIPLHWRRYAWRGYNQAEEMGYEIARQSQKPLLNCLKRIKHTKPQSQVNGMARIANVHDAFELYSNYKNQLKGKKILLVDDLLTSGSTARACAKTLYASGAQSVVMVVASRVT